MKINKLYDVVEGQDILTEDQENKDPIVEGLLYPEDYIMIVAEEKMGKTIISQQLTCNLSKGEPFLGVFDVPKPVKVWYFATEGKKRDLKDRFIRMNMAVEIDTAMVKLFPTRFRFNTSEGMASLREIVAERQDCLPDVIIIDALYRAVKGSIKDDQSVNEFHDVMGWLSKQCNNAAIILVHHMTKPQRGIDGQYFSRSDKDSFGSAFLAAAVDHILWIERWKKGEDDDEHCKDKVIRCDTQRGGNIPEALRIRLIEPKPLYFQVVSKHDEEKHKVISVLKAAKDGLCLNEILKRTKIKRSTAYIVIGELIGDKMITKQGTKERIYRYAF